MVNGRSRARPSAARSQQRAPCGTLSKATGASAAAVRLPREVQPSGARQMKSSYSLPASTLAR